MAVAACTPGTARSVSRRRRYTCVRPPDSDDARGSVIENVTRRDRSNPASTRVRLYTVRISRPAPMTRITASATSTVTSTRRRRWRALPRSPVSFKGLAGALVPLFAIGANPKSRPAAIEIAAAKTRTGTLMATCVVRGRLAGYRNTTARTQKCASQRPIRPPVTDNNTPSVIVCRSSRARLAPRAARTANSRRRAPARAMLKFARFTQPISRTRPAAACSTHTARLASPTIASCSVPARASGPAAAPNPWPERALSPRSFHSSSRGTRSVPSGRLRASRRPSAGR